MRVYLVDANQYRRQYAVSKEWCMRKNKKHKEKPSIKQRLKDGTLSPEVKKQLASLSQELGISEESLAELCVMMYRLYGKKR